MQAPPPAPRPQAPAASATDPTVAEFAIKPNMHEFASPARMRRRGTLERFHGLLPELKSVDYYRARFEKQEPYRVWGIPLGRRRVELIPGLVDHIEALKNASPADKDFIPQTTRRALILSAKIREFRAKLHCETDVHHELDKLDRILVSHAWITKDGDRVPDHKETENQAVSVHVSRADPRRPPAASPRLRPVEPTRLQFRLAEDVPGILRIPLTGRFAAQAERIPLAEWFAWGRQFGFSGIRYDPEKQMLTLCKRVVRVDAQGAERREFGRIVSVDRVQPDLPPGHDAKHSSPARPVAVRPEGVAVLDPSALTDFLALDRRPVSG